MGWGSSSPLALARAGAIAEFVQGNDHLHVNAFSLATASIGCINSPMIGREHHELWMTNVNRSTIGENNLKRPERRGRVKLLNFFQAHIQDHRTRRLTIQSGILD